MDFELKAALIFSGDIEEISGDIQEHIREANEDLLQRGVPDGSQGGGAEVVEHSVSSDTLDLTLVSGRYVRAHDALLRLRKKLSSEMGREHHVGVRDISIESYLLEFELDREPKESFKLPYLDELSFNGRDCTVSLSALSQDQLEENYVDRIISRIREKVDAQYYEGKSEKWELRWESEKKEMEWNKDPTEEMENKDWIKKGPTKGKWFYRPKAAKIMKTMEQLAVEEVLEPLGFEEIIESMMVPFDVWMDTGHMGGIPNEAYYISEPRTRDPEEWERFIDEVKISNEVPDDLLDQMTTSPRAGVCWAQCPVIYWSLRNETFADDNLPMRVYEHSIPSARYESGGRHGIERVDEFHRIEPVYIGTKEQLIQLKEDLIDRYKHVFEDILELEWRMAEVTPFYLQQAGQEEGEETEIDLGTVDFEAYLPYRGTREDSEWLEFQNLSVLKKYVEAFNIKSQTKELFSGCTGIGLERWTAAFLAQKGLETEEWPEGFKKSFGKMPTGIELM